MRALFGAHRVGHSIFHVVLSIFIQVCDIVALLVFIGIDGSAQVALSLIHEARYSCGADPASLDEHIVVGGLNCIGLIPRGYLRFLPPDHRVRSVGFATAWSTGRKVELRLREGKTSVIRCSCHTCDKVLFGNRRIAQLLLLVLLAHQIIDFLFTNLVVNRFQFDTALQRFLSLMQMARRCRHELDFIELAGPEAGCVTG